LPVERFVKVSAEPVPALSARTKLPFLSVNTLSTRWPHYLDCGASCRRVQPELNDKIWRDGCRFDGLCQYTD
jgi:hypothetical protein